MKYFFSLVLTFCLLVFFPFNCVSVDSKSDDKEIKILVLMGEWFGHAYYPLKDEFDSRGWKSWRIGVEGEYGGCYNKDNSIRLTSDLLIQEFKGFEQYDCLIIPSGPQFRKFMKDEEVKAFIVKAYEKGLIVSSFCAGNVLISSTGLLGREGHKLLTPEKVIEPKENLLIGPRGGGPKPDGNGYEGLNIKMICDSLEEKFKK